MMIYRTHVWIVSKLTSDLDSFVYNIINSWNAYIFVQSGLKTFMIAKLDLALTSSNFGGLPH